MSDNNPHVQLNLNSSLTFLAASRFSCFHTFNQNLKILEPIDIKHFGQWTSNKGIVLFSIFQFWQTISTQGKEAAEFLVV